MSEENYYSKLGYNYDAAGKVEDQVWHQRFLKEHIIKYMEYVLKQR